MLAEFLQQGALRLGLAIHHADVAEKITESVASEVLLQVLPLRRVGVAPGALDGSDDLGLEDVRGAEIQATAVEHAKDPVRRIQVGRSEEHTSELQSLMR